MIQYHVQGGGRLSGSVTISGAKNAAVAILPATLLVNGVCRVENVPDISDVRLLLQILSEMGAQIKRLTRNSFEIDCRHAHNTTASIELVRRIRASCYLIGVELGRFGHARVAMPGGCNFGVRPIDQHIKGFEAMGATVEQTGGYVCADAPENGLQGGHVYLDIVSVGATMNILLAAVLANGMTVIENCAKEPHIVDLANFLNAMGARISGAGTSTVTVSGFRPQPFVEHTIMPDRIVAATILCAGAACGGDVELQGVDPDHFLTVLDSLSEAGSAIIKTASTVRLTSTGRLTAPRPVVTQPYPGFPTDAQPPLMAACLRAKGTTVFTENIFTNRYRHAEEFRRLGAAVSIEGRVAYVTGVERLTGAPLTASDLRGGAALVIAGLSAEGTTRVTELTHIDRGYDAIERDLAALGAQIRRETT